MKHIISWVNKLINYLNKKIPNYFWYIIPIIIIVFGFLGLNISNSKYNFVFENMIWLPIELSITIFALNKLFNFIDEKRNSKRFVQVANRKNRFLISNIKKTVVNIAIENKKYNKNRDIVKLYDEILDNPTNYFNDKLFKSTREYLISYKPTKYTSHNYMSFVNENCSKLDKSLKEYTERFAPYFDDKLFKAISDFEISNNKFGLLKNSFMVNESKDNIIARESYDYLKDDAIEYVSNSSDLINILKEYTK